MALNKKLMLPVLVLAVIVVAFVFMVTQQQATAPASEDGNSVEAIEQDLEDLEREMDQMDSDFEELDKEIDQLEEDASAQ